MKFFDLADYESTWRTDADAREKAQNEREAIEAQEWTESDIPAEWREPSVELTPRQTGAHLIRATWPPEVSCCDQPVNFKHVPNLGRDPDTGYLEEDYFECLVCGSRICSQDYENIVQWADRKNSLVEEDELERARRRAPKEAA